MFQSAWFNKNKYIDSKIVDKIPDDFITIDKINGVRTIYYDEHCLECSAPACYSTCPKFIKRKDGACVRFIYGIKTLNAPKNILYNVKLKFRSWGKLEARINSGSLSPKEIKSLYKKDNKKTSIFKLASKILLKKDYELSRKYDGLKRKKYATIKSNFSFADDFLFQCYYNGKDNFNLFFEITDENNIITYKNTLFIKHGFNQFLLKLEQEIIDGGNVRLYPENNLEVELQIFSADFIQLKSAIPQVPAKKIKCVAWDLDNTLWGGILTESDPNKLKLRDGVLETIEELDRRGIIQIIVSKNNLDDVLPVLSRLKVDQYFVYKIVNWGSKSYNIYRASKLLNINVDTFSLIDDSDFERREVSSALPCVRTFNENELKTLLSCEALDIKITEESKNRRLSYIEEAKRKNIQFSFNGNNIEFIKSCEFVVDVHKISNEKEFNRSLELIQRTNQLNLSGKKYSEEEFSSLVKNENFYSYVVYAKDKYGEYGQVAFIYFNVTDRINVNEFAMSCRVASKYAENAVFYWLCKKFNLPISLKGKKTDRNSVLVDALVKAGFKNNSENDIILLDSDIQEIINYNIVKVVTNEFCK